MATVPIEEAEAQLRTLVARAAAGEFVEIGDPGLPRVRLVPVIDEALKEARRRGYGSMRGQFTVPDSFFDPLPEQELRLWEGE